MRRDKVLKDSHGVIVEREEPSLFCEKCRRWVDTNETHNMFSAVDGVRQPLAVWRCPACRGDAPPESVDAPHAPATGADISKDERLGPYRAVINIIKVNASGKTARAALACGHECCALPDATKARCRKCRPGKKEGDA
jgi:hypothetical protein